MVNLYFLVMDRLWKSVKGWFYKPSDEVSDAESEWSQAKKVEYFGLLNDLKLNPNEKLTLKKARTVDNNTLNDKALTSVSEIPKYIIEKLMIVDYHARAFKLNHNGVEQAIATFDDENVEDDVPHESIKTRVNPMDAFLAIFHCSDDFLRQDLAIKLAACQLSVPFLLPDPTQPSENVTMLLWALEGIKKSWKAVGGGNQHTTGQYVFVLEHSFPIVSFVRIGTNTFSKSALLNKIMSDVNGYHDFFFHKDCKGGGVERKFVDGLVELCWYLPGERKHDQAFQKEICFANLRGDARNYKKQLSILTRMSSILFLLLPSEYPEQCTKDVLIETVKGEAKVCFVFKEKPPEDAKQYFHDIKQEHRDKLFFLQKSTQANEDDFVEVIRKIIEKNINSSKSMPLKETASFVNDCGISLDENSDINSLWRENTESWIQMGPKDVKIKLKLQTQVPTLAKLERENFCPRPQANKSENERMDDIFKKRQEVKDFQKESLAKMDEQLYGCLRQIAVMNNVERQYALTILKHNLDKMSLKVLGFLQVQYRDAWLNIQKKKKQQKLESSELHALSDEEIRLRQLEETIIASSFGLEHVIREIAQMFQLTEESMIIYAEAAADMLLSGQPLELMDGDSSYIPFTWVNAVFNELVRKTNNAKIFVISVLGIQSSGKSTMLNTMFGLEFPVSAGRCTRGAFASLIPVSNSVQSDSNFEYILIIDTEGLRGSGDTEVRQHDNELATFAIGVADLTIVNIFGENYNDMKEFLEIAVHAFLKMKLVKEKRICQIVHQNVAAIEASDVLATERINLKKKLDDMAKLAAIQENCEDAFHELNDILSFDENDDVFYIPNLLQGSPPMAPVNPDYGRAVQKVKEQIISLMCLPERSHHPISQFQKRICDLWKAILRENFIFSFRNTIEVRAYTSLDQKYFEESVKTMVTGMTELEKKIQVSIMRSSADTREDIWAVGRMEIEDKAEELGKKMEKAMEDFFETNEDKATLEQWKENFMNRIKGLKDCQVMEVMRNCQATFNYWQSRREVDIKKQTCENELLAKAKRFIASVEDTEDVRKCTEKFEQEWQQWIKEVPPCLEKSLDINQEMTKVLFYTDKRLTGEMKAKCNAKRNKVVNFKNESPSIKNQLELGKLERFLRMFRNNPQLIIDAEKIQDDAITAAINFARNTSKSGVRCRPADLKRMYHLVTSTIHENTKNKKFKFPNSLLCDILLFVFANTYNDFCEMEKRYIQERDIQGELERNLRPKLEKYFLNMCQEMQKEVRAATLMVDILQTAMQLELNRTMGPAVAGEILKKNEFQSKGQFHATALIQLGEKCIFESFTNYLCNPVKYLRDRLVQSIEYYCLDNADNAANLLLQNEVKKIEDKVLEAISTASQRARSSSAMTFSLWIKDFVDNCSTLAITTEMFNVAAIDEDLKEFKMFESQLIKLVKEYLQLLVQQGVNHQVYKAWTPAPHEKLLDLMFGCQACCPFCKGLCDQTVRDHVGGHSTRIHRPQGITGYHYIDTEILVSSICTASVAGDGTFKNVDTSDELHPYKDYQTVNDYYKSWSIPPDSSFEASTYWKWFMATFSQELADFYRVNPPEIPLAWKNISFQDARNQLRKEFNLV